MEVKIIIKKKTKKKSAKKKKTTKKKKEPEMTAIEKELRELEKLLGTNKEKRKKIFNW